MSGGWASKTVTYSYDAKGRLVAAAHSGSVNNNLIARGWTEAPSLIVTSPYLHLRTRQTAQATIERFSGLPVETWPIEEFAYLQPSRWNGTKSAERMPHILRSW